MLHIGSLSVGYTDRLVLHELTLDLLPGQVLAIIGPNGTGKSTLVRAISGVLSPCSGSIHIDGRDITHVNVHERSRYMAVVPQAHSLPDDFGVYETILLGRTPHLDWLGHIRPHDHELVRSALERLKIIPLADRKIGELSGGEQQLVLLARALAQDTPILLLDEPTSFLDIDHQTRILDLVRGLALETGRMVLMVIHDLNLAALYADRIALLSEGNLYALGTPCEVLTSENLAAVYHISAMVIPHPVYGTPLVLPGCLPASQLVPSTSYQTPAVLGK